MGRLVCANITSLDGYVADRGGRFDWAMPDEQVHLAINEQQRDVGMHLYGRRLYEVMRAWETLGRSDDDPPVERDFARSWRDADKVVFSKTLATVSTGRTSLRRSFDPAEVRALVDAADTDALIGGPGLAGAALRAGIVDEVHQYVVPVAVGGGTRFLPDGLEARLTLTASHTFPSGIVHLGYRVDRDGQD